MGKGKVFEVQSGPRLVSMLRHNYQDLELHRHQGKVLVKVMRSWLKKQRVQRD